MPDRRASLWEVALASGFADQHHLARVFRRVTRLTPKQLSPLAVIVSLQLDHTVSPTRVSGVVQSGYSYNRKILCSS
jgi:AraC-like DNA-binding protein